MKVRGARIGRTRSVQAAIPGIRSPLAPKSIPELPPLAGVQMATGEAGVKYSDRADVLLALLDPGTQVAGIFTKSKTAAAPVDWCRKNVGGSVRALVVNSGNANAFTGVEGVHAVRSIARSLASIIGCSASEVLMASTGVIGEPLPHERITRLLSSLHKKAGPVGWRLAAEAITTTDTFPKLATATATIGGRKVTINGICKGSGMIAPDMATMLAFVFTDANLPARVLQSLLADAAQKSFNCITVDGDTSTSDTLLLFATGKGAPHPKIKNKNDKLLAPFKEQLNALLLDLALQVVKDGEGAQKLVQIEVTGAKNNEAARRIAFSIANSPLVKTAIAGGDANWGRIVMAVGKAGEAADRDRLKIAFGGHVVAENGQRAKTYNEKRATDAVSGRHVLIEVDLGLGLGSARVWTCDLTEGYIRINGSYRT